MSKINIFETLAKVQEAELSTPSMEMKFEEKIKISGFTNPVTGLAKFISLTESGNFKYALTTGPKSHQFFFSKKELTDLKLTNKKFGVQLLTDEQSGKEKTLYWY